MVSEFQRRATAEGRLAQDWAGQLLRGVGFQDLERNVVMPELGVTVNYIGSDKVGKRWYFDISGAATSERAGLRRTDTVWKTLGRASVLHVSGVSPLLVVSSDLPAPGSVGDCALRAARSTYFDVLHMMAVESKARLRRYAEGGADLPLPGFLAPRDIYGSKARSGKAFGAGLEVPLDLVGDPLGPISPEAVVTAMPHRVVVYIPSQSADGTPISKPDLRAAQTAIRSILSDFAGGCTAVNAQGSWADPLAGIVNEHVLVVESYSKDPISKSVVQAAVDVVLNDLDQHTAAVLINQSMYQFER